MVLMIYANNLDCKGYPGATMYQAPENPERNPLGLGHGVVVPVVDYVGAYQTAEHLLHARASFVMPELPIVFLKVYLIFLGLAADGGPNLTSEVLYDGLLDIYELLPGG